jgi:hypothetical protein
VSTRAKPLSRFKRQHGARRKHFEPEERDRAIIKLVYDYRFITSAQIQGLIPGSERGILRRLQILFHHGYLDRLKLSNNKPIVYGLGNEGAGVLTSHFGIDRQKVDWTTKNREAGERYIAHALMIANFRSTLELAMREMPDAALQFWEPEGSFKDEVSYESEHKTQTRTPIVPDAYFALRVGKILLPFFLEADRSTMTNDRFLRKLTGYYHFWRQDKHKNHGLSAFRVLTITISVARKENLRAIAKNADTNKQGFAGFWFAYEKEYAEHPENLFKPIWQTPRDDSYRALLER